MRLGLERGSGSAAIRAAAPAEDGGVGEDARTPLGFYRMYMKLILFGAEADLQGSRSADQRLQGDEENSDTFCVSVWTLGGRREAVGLTGRVWRDAPSVSVTIQTAADAALSPCSDLVWFQSPAEQLHTVNPTKNMQPSV